MFLSASCVGLDADRRQAGNGHMHREERPSHHPQPGHPHLQSRKCRTKTFLPLTCLWGGKQLISPSRGSSQFSVAPTVSWPFRPAGIHPLGDRGSLAGGHTAPHNYACSTGQHPQLNKSPPTTESIQATVKENKQGLAHTHRGETSWTTPTGNMLRAHFLICFAAFGLSPPALIVPLLPSPLEPRQSRRSACHIGRLQLAYNCAYWKRITMAGTAWKPLSQWTVECWLGLLHIHLD